MPTPDHQDRPKTFQDYFDEMRSKALFDNASDDTIMVMARNLALANTAWVETVIENYQVMLRDPEIVDSVPGFWDAVDPHALNAVTSRDKARAVVYKFLMNAVDKMDAAFDAADAAAGWDAYRYPFMKDRPDPDVTPGE